MLHAKTALFSVFDLQVTASATQLLFEFFRVLIPGAAELTPFDVFTVTAFAGSAETKRLE